MVARGWMYLWQYVLSIFLTTKSIFLVGWLFGSFLHGHGFAQHVGGLV
jgi:hypothetical protein